MRKIFYLIIVIGLFGSGNEAVAQMNRKAIKKNNRRIATFRGKKAWFSKEKRYNAIGISVSALNYFGDLSPKVGKLSTDISFTRPAIAFSFTHRFGPRYSLTGSFMYGALKGSDASSANENDKNAFYRYVRNASFRNRIKELSIVATIDLFENQSTYISRVKWTPYIYAGVALFYNNPQAQVPQYHIDADGVNPPAKFDNAGQWVDLQPLGTEGQYSTLDPADANHGIKPYHKIQPAIPFGFGARFRLNEVFDVSAEIGFRYTFTDYIDDVSKSYVDPGLLKSDLARAMAYRSGELPQYDPAIMANHSNAPDGTFIGGPLQKITGKDGVDYWLYPGFGSEYHDAGTNKRGSATNNNDYYMVTTIRLTYILGKTFHRAKFR